MLPGDGSKKYLDEQAPAWPLVRLAEVGVFARSPALPAPVLERLAAHRWALRVLRLEPVRRVARPVGRAPPLRHDALKAHDTSLREEGWTVTGSLRPRKASAALVRSFSGRASRMAMSTDAESTNR